MSTIIYAHPNPSSFNAAFSIMCKRTTGNKSFSLPYLLYKEQFVQSSYFNGERKDAILVNEEETARYRTFLVEEADYTFIHPIQYGGGGCQQF